jgi:hypothetical protein
MSALIPVPDGHTLHLVRVNPNIHLSDFLHPDEPDESLWQIESWFGDDPVIALVEVQDALLDQDVRSKHGRVAAEALADAHILSVLHHPRSPYALGYQPEDGPMWVIYRGRFHDRKPDGVLVLVGGRAEGWPTKERWRRVWIATRLLARRRGLL